MVSSAEPAWELVVHLAGPVLPDALSAPLSIAVPAPPRDLGVLQPDRPAHVKAVYATGWIAGHSSRLADLLALVHSTELNSVVIEIKDDTGVVSYRSGVATAELIRASVAKIQDISGALDLLKKNGVYPIARLVVFKDPVFAAARPDLAVHDASGRVWHDKQGSTWTDPRQRQVWEYNLELAKEAAALGFREIQFDYVRFPDDARLSAANDTDSMGRSRSDVIEQFLEYAWKELEPTGVVVTADVFGLVCSASTDMGIGQTLQSIAKHVDYIAPMVYPSHYRKGEYGIANPNAQPRETVARSLKDGASRLNASKSRARLIPWLQDFSLGYPYGPAEVRAQIDAALALGIQEFMLWSPRNVYTRAALRGHDAADDPPAKGLHPPATDPTAPSPPVTEAATGVELDLRLDDGLEPVPLFAPVATQQITLSTGF